MPLDSSSNLQDVINEMKRLACLDIKPEFINTLNEMESNGDYIKSKLVEVIGTPTTTTETYKQIVEDIQNCKNTLAINLSNKGVITNGADTLNSLAIKVSDTGKYKVGDLVPSSDMEQLLYTDYELPSNINSNIVIDNNDCIYTCADGYLYKLDKNGNQLGFIAISDPNVLRINNTGLYCSSNIGKIYKIDTNNLAIIWEYAISGVKDIDIYPDGSVAYCTSTGFVGKINSSGLFVSNAYNGFSFDSICINNGILYCGTSGSEVYYTDSNVAILTKCISSVRMSPYGLVSHPNGYVYGTSINGYLYKFDYTGIIFQKKIDFDINNAIMYIDNDYIYILGYSYGSTRSIVLKYDSIGNLKWQWRLLVVNVYMGVKDDNIYATDHGSNIISKIYMGVRLIG